MEETALVGQTSLSRSPFPASDKSEEEGRRIESEAQWTSGVNSGGRSNSEGRNPFGAFTVDVDNDDGFGYVRTWDGCIQVVQAAVSIGIAIEHEALDTLGNTKWRSVGKYLMWWKGYGLMEATLQA
ncbi:hypothetical protein F2Q70_00040839 [Brassica cretica]|uniref:Uncharacterized protein n=1 Tax=Brassica cretica TaxID=69181 RepID=A0A8S9K4P5_BRACR|nr:hypothetical protein F2Q70_00040839 [Brassica cretica]